MILSRKIPALLCLLATQLASAAPGEWQVTETYVYHGRKFSQTWSLSDAQGAGTLSYARDGEAAQALSVFPSTGLALQDAISRLSIRKKGQADPATLKCESHFRVESTFGAMKYCHGGKQRSSELSSLVRELWSVSPNGGQFVRRGHQR